MPVVNAKLSKSTGSPYCLVLQCMCIKNVISLSFIDEAKEIKLVESQNLCSVYEQGELGTHKCL